MILTKWNPLNASQIKCLSPIKVKCLNHIQFFRFYGYNIHRKQSLLVNLTLYRGHIICKVLYWFIQNMHLNQKMKNRFVASGLKKNGKKEKTLQSLWGLLLETEDLNKRVLVMFFPIQHIILCINHARWCASRIFLISSGFNLAFLFLRRFLKPRKNQQ